MALRVYVASPWECQFPPIYHHHHHHLVPRITSPKRPDAERLNHVRHLLMPGDVRQVSTNHYTTTDQSQKITSLSPMPRSKTWKAQKRSAFLSHQRRAIGYCIQRLIQTSIRLGMIGWFAIPDILKANNNAALSSTTNQRHHHWNLAKGYPKLQKIWKELSFPASSSCLVSIHPILILQDFFPVPSGKTTCPSWKGKSIGTAFDGPRVPRIT